MMSSTTGTSHHSSWSIVNVTTTNLVVYPVCPPQPTVNASVSVTTLYHYVAHPSSVSVFTLMTVFALVACVMIMWHYNSVNVFNRKIRTDNISNTWWILFYAAVAFRASTQAAMLAISSQQEQVEDHVIYLLALALHGVSCLLLAFALNHQRKYRSAGALPTVLAAGQRSTPRMPINAAGTAAAAGGGVGAQRAGAPPRRTPSPATARLSGAGGSKHASQRALLAGGSGGGGGGGAKSVAGWVRENCGAWECVSVLLFALFLVALFCNALIDGKSAPLTAYYWFFAATFCAQRLLVVTFVLKIVLARASADGPTRRSKALLAFGALTYIPMMLVPLLWPLLPAAHDCAFYVASWLDFVNLLDLTTMILFFAFCRAEFMRNMEECIWTTVSSIQDSFDFRRF
jgi:hypothetical protein